MTYCAALRTNRGLIFMSDTRTNAGVDNVSVMRKMHTWENTGERVVVLLAAGNLATTQAVISVLDERAKAPSERQPSLLDTPSMFQTARLVGETLREVIHDTGSDNGQESEAKFHASFILGGQIAGGEPRLFLIYPEGNFIESSDDTPFFQIGEHKYGRPIIVRAFNPDLSFAEAAKLLLISFDSTVRANLSVGLPVDLLYYESGSYQLPPLRRFTADDPYYRRISEGWSDSLRAAFAELPEPQL